MNLPIQASGLAEDMRRVLSLFEDAPGAMIVTSGPEHRIEMLNQAFRVFIEQRPVIGLAAADAFPNMVDRGFRAMLDEAYGTGEALSVKGRRILVDRLDGGAPREAWANFIIQPIRDATGAVCGLFSQGFDVTNEKLANDRLGESREQLQSALDATRAILDNSQDVICVIDPDGLFLQVNRHAERVWGYRPEELVGRNYLDFVHPDDRARSRDVARRIEAGIPTNAIVNRYLHKDGSIVPVSWSTTWSDSHQCTFCVGRDMREHEAAEEKLRQAQKMEAIGRLSGGVAHDFNNLLTVVIGAAETLAETLAGHPELEPVARVALEAAERGAELVSQLLAISRTQPLTPQAIDCNRFLESLAPILRRTLGPAIAVELSVPASPPSCSADLTQLTSAMLNLCINARDAMPDGGRLLLGVEAGPAGEVVLSVGDDGEGMTPQVRARALEPFFTTKPEGKGSGLGLAMVYGFAMQSGGRLEIESTPGIGTRVSLCLPVAGDSVTAPRAAPAAAAAPAPGRRVLLVEDDELVRGQVVRHLSALGCRIHACGNGHDALDVLAGGERIDLMMTDINMPGGLNGRQLADHARLLEPGLPILFTSGHTDDPILRHVGHDPRAAFLSKPYRRAELAAKLAELMPA